MGVRGLERFGPKVVCAKHLSFCEALAAELSLQKLAVAAGLRQLSEGSCELILFAPRVGTPTTHSVVHCVLTATPGPRFRGR